MTSQEIETWIREHPPKVPPGSAVRDLSRPDRHRFEAEGVAMEFVTAVDYDRVCAMLRESEAARGEQMRTIEVLAAECRAWRSGHRTEWFIDTRATTAIANTNAHAPARRLVEGEQHEH